MKEKKQMATAKIIIAITNRSNRHKIISLTLQNIPSYIFQYFEGMQVDM